MSEEHTRNLDCIMEAYKTLEQYCQVMKLKNKKILINDNAYWDLWHCLNDLLKYKNTINYNLIIKSRINEIKEHMLVLTFRIDRMEKVEAKEIADAGTENQISFSTI